MEKLFNFEDKTLNKGFQIDMSVLTPEQREHILQILQTRGMELPIDHIPYGGRFFLRYSDNSIGYSGVPYPTSIVSGNFPLIDYPTLCRAAVQLKCGDSTGYLISDPKIKEVTDYAFVARVSLITVPDGQHGILLIGYSSEGIISGNELKQEEFEAKLRGISPVVKEAENKHIAYPIDMNLADPLGSNFNPNFKEAEKVEPKRYMKAINTGLIVEMYQDNDKTFSGKIVDPNGTTWEVGREHGSFLKKMFEPCDYTEPVETSPEEPNKVNTLLATIEQVRKQVIDLEQKNYELKAQLQNNWSEKETLNNALARIAELEAELAAKNELLSNTEQLPVYDAEWLDKILQSYDANYRYYGNNKLVNIDTGHCKYISLDPKTSADIAIRAAAKELNGGKVGTEAIFINLDGNYEAMSPNNLCGFGLVKFVDAQKAIDILNQIDPQILKNYFA